jgi:hypothetical protein
MYSGEYDACDVTLSVYPHRASLKNMPDDGGNRTYDLWNTNSVFCGPETAVLRGVLCAYIMEGGMRQHFPCDSNV